MKLRTGQPGKRRQIADYSVFHANQVLSLAIIFLNPQNYVPASHGFSPPAPRDFTGLVDSHSSADVHLFEMQIKPELRIDGGSEDIDMEYMMEMPLECENGNEEVCISIEHFLICEVTLGWIEK